MQNKNKAALWSTLLILAATIAITAFAYPRLPDPMVTHWGVSDQPNGTMPRFWGAWSIPLLTLGMVILLWFLPAIDPRKENYANFRRVYDGFMVGMAAFMAYIQALMLGWNLGYPLPIGRAIAPAIGGIFVAAAFLIRDARPNWFVGIRTPWTLSSTTVWDKTHRAAFLPFLLGGALTICGMAWEPLMWLGLGIVMLAAFGTVVYSYFLYANEQKRSPSS